MDAINSVLQDWVMRLPLREQGVLITGVRGCDLTPKPLEGESPERKLVAFLRYCILNPADKREIDIPGAFFSPRPPFNTEWKPSMFGHYPQHWVAHVMHCFEVVAYRHPDAHIAAIALGIYERFVFSFHLRTETREHMIERLSEDRISKNNVVS